MNGPTICRVSNGSTRRTLNPPKSRSRPPITCRLAMDCPYEPLPAAIMAKDRAAHREFGCFPHCGPFFAPGCFDVLTVDSKASKQHLDRIRGLRAPGAQSAQIGRGL